MGGRGDSPGTCWGWSPGSLLGGEGELELGQGPKRGQRESRQVTLRHSGATRVTAGSGQSGTLSPPAQGVRPLQVPPHGEEAWGVAWPSEATRQLAGGGEPGWGAL